MTPDVRCAECADVGYYTTEGSQEACEAAGLVVLESSEGCSVVVCPRCPNRQQRRQFSRWMQREARVGQALDAAEKWRNAWTGGHNRQARRDMVRARRRRNDGRLKKLAGIITRVRSAR